MWGIIDFLLSRDWWPLIWCGWIGYFVLFEAIALYTNNGRTFSHYTWHAMDSRPAVVWFVVCFGIWCLVHFLTRGRLA